MMEIKLSLIIVTYNGEELVKNCLDSIKKFNDIGDALEVIVSDNSPSENLYNSLHEEYPWVKIIKNSVNGGFGYGNNRGAEASKGQYILFLNPDTILVEPVFSYAISKFEQEQELAMFGFKLIDADGRYNHPHALRDSFGIIHVLKQNYYWNKDIFLGDRMFITGADIFIRKDIFVNSGMFDEKIFMYYEESDLIRRMFKLNKNIRISYFPEKSIVHLEGGTTISDPERIVNAEKKAMKSLKYYCDKYQINFKGIIKKLIRLQHVRILKYHIKKDIHNYKIEKGKLKLYKDIEVDLHENSNCKCS